MTVLVRKSVVVALLATCSGAFSMRVDARQTPPQLPQVAAPAPPFDPGPVFRVFMKDGRAFASYGECAILDDRVVFTLIVGDGGVTTQYQLMSLPKDKVDLDRTAKYRESVRSARYAATRGETDYLAMTAEVSRTLDELTKITEPAKRLEAAEEAKKRLLNWSEENYHYRAKDIQELANLFDEVITQLRVAAGGSRLSIDLVAGAPPEPEEPVRMAPTLRQSIELALSAADTADVGPDRMAILRAASEVATGTPGLEDLAGEISRRMDEEQAAGAAYDALAADVLTRARAALDAGDLRASTAARNDAIKREQAFKSKRADRWDPILHELDDLLERTRARRDALDRYAAMRPKLLAYERSVRPVLAALDGAAPVLRAITDMNGPGYSWLVKTEATLQKVAPLLAGVEPPEDLVDVHATLSSALRHALEACKRRKLAIAARDTISAQEASASSTGAGLLLDQARGALVERLYPPKTR